MDLSERKLKILQAIVGDYIRSAEPVGSRTLSKKYDMGISAATIRNEMSDLEEMGYLTHPHTSSGRVPSEKAYRLYVNEMMKKRELTEEEKDYLQEYLDEVAALPTYSDGEKLAFSIAAMAGETDAQQRLIEIHLADVAEIAKLYAGQGVLLEDLVGEGNLALSFGVTMLGSLEKPDEVEGMLGKMIMDAMEEYIAEHAENSKIDKRVEDKVNKVADKARELAEELHRKVTTEELMEETGMSRKMIEDAIRMSGFKIEDIDNNAKDSL